MDERAKFSNFSALTFPLLEALGWGNKKGIRCLTADCLADPDRLASCATTHQVLQKCLVNCKASLLP